MLTDEVLDDMGLPELCNSMRRRADRIKAAYEKIANCKKEIDQLREKAREKRWLPKFAGEDWMP